MNTLHKKAPGWFRAIAAALLFAACMFATACATSPEVVNHAFSYDTRVDSPEIEVLDYRYSTRQPSDYSKSVGRAPQADNINGAFQRGDTLFVKWRTRATGNVFEDTVDLRGKLPRDIEGQRLHFMIRGEQLYVYLISPERRPVDWPPNGPRRYQHLKVFTIYPASTPTKQ
jgi:hypothetical protein